MIYTAEPGSPSAERLRLLASWATTGSIAAAPRQEISNTGGPSR
jgi:hypothetical protein